MRRLAIVVALIGAVIATVVWGFPAFQRLERQQWAHDYFVSYVAEHPELTIKKEGGGIYFLDDKPHPEWDWNKSRGEFSWDWVAIKRLPSGVESGVEWYQFYIVAVPGFCVALLLWLLIHTVAWIHAGFQDASVRS